MKLDPQQIQEFDREGYLFFPGLFTREETKVLTDEVPRLYAQRRPENVREKGSDAVRTNFAAHMYSTPFAKLARHPRMVEPIMQLFSEELYMHQFKINRSEEHTSELQSPCNLVCRLLLEKKKICVRPKIKLRKAAYNM